MIRFITERNVVELLTMEDSIAALDEAIGELGRGKAFNKPRQVVGGDAARLSVLPAAIPSKKILGFKTYTVGLNDALRFWVMLFGDDGEIKAMIEAEHLSAVRTGAACGVATKYMSRPESSTVGLLGTGYNSPAQLEAICAVRTIKQVRAFSRNRDNLVAFCNGMTKHLGVEVVPASDARDAVRNMDIITTITSSAKPVLFGDWLEKGVHVNLAGAMKPSRKEIDTKAVTMADLLVADDIEQAREEAGEMIDAATEGAFDWSTLKGLGSIVAAGKNVRETGDEITVFKAHGTGLWDVATALRIYELALARDVGVDLPIEQPSTPLYKGQSEMARAWAAE